MALTAKTIIEAAEDLSYPWSGALVPLSHGQLLQYLGILDRRVVSFTAHAAPHLLAAVQSDITLGPNSAHPSGYVLSPANAVAWKNFEYIRVTTSFRFPIRIVGEAEYGYAVSNPAGVVRVGRFYPSDPFQRGWSGSDTRTWFEEGDKIAYRAIRLPPVPASFAATLDSPDPAETYFVVSLRNLLWLHNGAPEETLFTGREEEVMLFKDLRIAIRKQAEAQEPAFRETVVYNVPESVRLIL